MNSSVAMASHKSNFSKKCTLLSQYLKENGSFGDLSLGLSPKQHGGVPTTKDFLPMIEKSAGEISQAQDLNFSPKDGEKERGHAMTIFYGGKVIVFDNFDEEKAKEIMGFATKASSMSQPKSKTITTTPPAPTTPFRNPLAEGDMPIMRNRSLARFIAKRKDRIKAKAPYEAANGQDASTSKPVDDNKLWLGLAAQPSSSQQNEIQFL